MGEWREGFLEEIAEIEMGQSPKGESCNSTGKGSPLLNGPTEFGIKSPKPIQFTTDPKKKSKEGDLLFCVRGSTTGKMNWADQSYAIGRGIAAIRHKNGEEYNRYLRGLIEYNLSGLLSSATGSTFPNVSRNQLEKLEILLPSIIEQEAISHVLSSLDDKIDLLHRQNKTLEQMAETLFRQWFVEEAEFVSDKQLVLGDLIDSVSITHKFPNQEIVFLNTSDIYLGQVLTHSTTEVVGLPGQAKKSIKKGDILFSEIRPANGRYAFIDFEAENYVVSTKLMVLRSKNVVSQEFIYFYLTNPKTIQELQLIAESRSGTFPQITFDNLKDFRINIPSDKKLFEIEFFCKEVIVKIKSNQTQIRTLENIRDTLLPKLMSGEVVVEMNNGFDLKR